MHDAQSTSLAMLAERHKPADDDTPFMAETRAQAALVSTAAAHTFNEKVEILKNRLKSGLSKSKSENVLCVENGRKESRDVVANLNRQLTTLFSRKVSTAKPKDVDSSPSDVVEIDFDSLDA